MVIFGFGMKLWRENVYLCIATLISHNRKGEMVMFTSMKRVGLNLRSYQNNAVSTYMADGVFE